MVAYSNGVLKMSEFFSQTLPRIASKNLPEDPKPFLSLRIAHDIGPTFIASQNDDQDFKNHS